jgi:hypothetical protein
MLPKRALVPFIIMNQFVKSLSLWRAARNNDRGWYLLLNFTNTMGILDIFYMTRRKKRQEKKGVLEKLYP